MQGQQQIFSHLNHHHQKQLKVVPKSQKHDLCQNKQTTFQHKNTVRCWVSWQVKQQKQFQNQFGQIPTNIFELVNHVLEKADSQECCWKLSKTILWSPACCHECRTWTADGFISSVEWDTGICVSATLSKHLKSRDGQVSLFLLCVVCRVSCVVCRVSCGVSCVVCRVFLGETIFLDLVFFFFGWLMGNRTRALRFEQIPGLICFFWNLVKKESVGGCVVVEGKRANKEKANELQKRKNRWNETKFCLCFLNPPNFFWFLIGFFLFWKQEYPHILWCLSFFQFVL